MKILVTGATGMIGNNLINYLSKNEKLKVYAGVRAYNDKIKIRQVILGELNESRNFENKLKNIDVVIHSAGIAHRIDKKINKNTEEYDKINNLGTQNFAYQCYKSGVKRFIFLSTIKVNGEFTKKNKKFSINDNVSPSDLYAKSKFDAENYLLNKLNQDMKVVILRLPLVYGYGVKGNFLNLLRIIENKKVLPFGMIKNKRSFLYVENLADIIFHCLKNNKVIRKKYLLCDGEDLSFFEIIKIISNQLKSDNLILPIPIFVLNFLTFIIGKKSKFNKVLYSMRIDNSEIVKDINWVPPYSVKTGLKKTCQWYKSYKDFIS